MSRQSEEMLALIASGQLDEAGRLVLALEEDSSDWHDHYAAGQCFRFARDYGACFGLVAVSSSKSAPSLDQGILIIF